MKKSLLILFLPFSAFAVDEQFFTTNQACVLQLGYYQGTSLITTDIKTTISDLPSRLFRNSCGLHFKNVEDTLQTPNIANTAYTTSTTLSYNIRPVSIDGVAYPWKFFPSLEQFFVLAEIAYVSGLREPVFEYQADRYYNISFSLLFNELFFGTNTSFRSSVLLQLGRSNSFLENIYGDLLSVVANSDDTLAALNSLSSNYSKVNSAALISFSDFLQNSVQDGVFSSSEASSYLNRYNSLSGSSKDYFAQSIRDYDKTSRAFSDFLSRVSANKDDLNSLGREINKSLNDSINAGVSGAAHFHGATTNLLQRITNNTEHIKSDLQAWRTDATNRLERQWDGIKKIRDNTGDTAAGVAHIVNDGVKINGPVQFVLGTDFLGVELNIGDINKLIEGFADGSDAAMQKWLREWDRFKDSQLPYMSRFSSFIESNTNILTSIDSKLDFGFTNIFDTIYFALTNLDFAASTNSYMLLSDYSDYINTSGLSDLLSVLDDDSYSAFKDEISSIGADDVSSGYGRWWRYYTGLSTIQANSVFKIANLLIDHEKLLKDLKRENIDVVELSDFNVFSELLSKIPSQTHIDNKISELTNSIDQSGFARIRELIPDLTNRLSVASALYDHDFALPTDISWVLIPGDSELNIRERVIHISPSEHYRVFQVLHYGIAFSYCLVNLILLPKFLLLLVRLFDRVWNKSEHLIYNSTQS